MVSLSVFYVGSTRSYQFLGTMDVAVWMRSNFNRKNHSLVHKLFRKFFYLVYFGATPMVLFFQHSSFTIFAVANVTTIRITKFSKMHVGVGRGMMAQKSKDRFSSRQGQIPLDLILLQCETWNLWYNGVVYTLELFTNERHCEWVEIFGQLFCVSALGSKPRGIQKADADNFPTASDVQVTFRNQ